MSQSFENETDKIMFNKNETFIRKSVENKKMVYAIGNKHLKKKHTTHPSVRLLFLLLISVNFSRFNFTKKRN